MKSYSKIIILLIVGFLFVVSSTININNFSSDSVIKGINAEDNDNINLKSPRKSEYWNNFSFIHINDNWSIAAGYDWCSGNGSLDNPYTLENFTIDASGSLTGSGILINNSKNEYFAIRNVTVYNTGTSASDAGIKLKDTNNGTIINNTLINGKNGIFLNDDCHFNNISRNIIHSTSFRGIRIDKSNYNNITSNIIYNNSVGIKLYSDDSGGTCTNNIIHNNSIFNNTYGIHLFGDTVFGSICANNTIINNTINNNTRGIYLDDTCKRNNITYNLISNNSDTGLFLSMPGCRDNLIYQNYFIGNELHAKDNGWIVNNYWDNGSIGNYWDNYTELGAGADDKNDDNIGDIIYPIAGSAGRNDSFPIWEDGDDAPPEILIILQANDTFHSNAPVFQIYTYDLYSINATFYSIYNISVWLENETFTGNSVDINQTLWSTLLDGDILIRFYVNDSAAHINHTDALVIKDTLPPTITIISPTSGQDVPSAAPVFTVEIFDEKVLNATWYTLNSGTTKYFFIDNDTIDSYAWGILPDGSVIITFYANDSAGNEHSISVTVTKGEEGDDDEKAVEGLPWYIQAVLTGAISAMVGVSIKMTYSTRKKKKGLVEQVRLKMRKIENNEQFLRENLGKVDFGKIKEAWLQFDEREITQEDFIRKGMKALGNKFTDPFLD